jgi:hypothetical protein
MENTDNTVTVALGIPTINRNDLLQEALEVYKETWYGRHVFIVDNGNQEIKTCIGGFLSILFILFMTFYFILKSSRALQNQDWSIT